MESRPIYVFEPYSNAAKPLFARKTNGRVAGTSAPATTAHINVCVGHELAHPSVQLRELLRKKIRGRCL